MLEENKDELVVLAMPIKDEKGNPTDNSFEQTLKIEWTPRALITEKVQREIIIQKLKKESEAIQKQIAEHQKHIDHLGKILDLPEVKEAVDAEKEFLASQAVEVKEEK